MRTLTFGPKVSMVILLAILVVLMTGCGSSGGNSSDSSWESALSHSVLYSIDFPQTSDGTLPHPVMLFGPTLGQVQSSALATMRDSALSSSGSLIVQVYDQPQAANTYIIAVSAANLKNTDGSPSVAYAVKFSGLPALPDIIVVPNHVGLDGKKVPLILVSGQLLSNPNGLGVQGQLQSYFETILGQGNDYGNENIRNREAIAFGVDSVVNASSQTAPPGTVTL